MITLENGSFFSYDMIGEFHSSGEWMHPRRRIGSFEAILVLAGTVYIAEETQRYTLQKKQLLLLEPQKEHYGYQSVASPVAFYWFHFFTDLAVPLKLYTGEDIYETEQLMKKLLHISNTPTCSRAAADAAGYLIYEELLRLASEEASANQTLNAQIMEYVRTQLRHGVTVAEVARHFGYHADYIGKYFKKIHGIGLKEYIAAQRLKLAKELLLTTNMNIKQVSAEVGYAEENLFIKFFTYHEKISPTAFQNLYCNTHINHK